MPHRPHRQEVDPDKEGTEQPAATGGQIARVKLQRGAKKKENFLHAAADEAAGAPTSSTPPQPQRSVFLSRHRSAEDARQISQLASATAGCSSGGGGGQEVNKKKRSA